MIKQANGQPAVTRVSAFGYDATSGMLKTETVEPGNTQFEVSKTYEHDSFGNIIQTTTTADGKTITDRSVYDSKGRYVTESYNTLNQKTSKTNDIIFGTVTSITDINGLTATKQYDFFGREKLTTGPDGSKAVTAYRWCNNDEDAPSNALWFKYVEVSGNPPVIVYYDKFKRELRKVVIGFDGKHIYTDIKYNDLGQVSQQSDPYFKGDTPLWTTLAYDELGRIKQKTLPDGSLIKITYAGLTCSRRFVICGLFGRSNKKEEICFLTKTRCGLQIRTSL